MALDISKYGTPTNTSPTGQSFDVSKYGTPVANPQANIQVAQEPTNAVFPAQKNESVTSGAMKLIGNIPKSALDFAKGAISSLNPVNIAKNVSQIPTEFSALVKESGGVGEALKQTGLQIAPTAYGQLVPKATQQIISGDFEGARNTITNDPVGQILPYLLVGKSAAEKAGKGAQFDSAISKMASPITAPTEATISGIKGAAAGSTKFGVSQATGLSPETISRVISDPELFKKEAQQSLDRATIANEVKTVLDTKKATLKETGAGYTGVREANIPVAVKPTLLSDTIKNTTGLDIAEGKLQVNPRASIRDAKDIRAIQNVYDLYQPLFDRGVLTTEEFLNLRTDLGKMARYERELTKSQPLENLSDVMRGKLNTEIRPKVPNLESLDTTFGSQISEINRLQSGVLDKKGNLTDTGINRIANAGNKDILLAKLEEISPGITQKIRTLKAVEDIKAAGGQKVGTYARAGGLLTGVVTMNPYLIVGSILSIPEIAVPLLRGVGMTLPKIESTLKLLNVPFKAVNKAPNLFSGENNVKPDSTVNKNNPLNNSLNTQSVGKPTKSEPNTNSDVGVFNGQDKNIVPKNSNKVKGTTKTIKKIETVKTTLKKINTEIDNATQKAETKFKIKFPKGFLRAVREQESSNIDNPRNLRLSMGLTDIAMEELAKNKLAKPNTSMANVMENAANFLAIKSIHRPEDGSAPVDMTTPENAVKWYVQKYVGLLPGETREIKGQDVTYEQIYNSFKKVLDKYSK